MKKFLFFILGFMSLSLVSFGETNEKINKETKYIIRPIYGRANYSKLRRTFGEIDDWDEQASYFVGVQLERFVAKNYKYLPIDFTVLGSIFYHEQDIKVPDGKYTGPLKLNGKDTYQLNIGVKLYYKKFPWNRLVRTRLGIGDGISYTGEHLDIETQNYNSENKTNRSRLLNYLDISLSLNLKDITDMDQLENSYIGVGISHRSGIQGLINDVHGGSNFATIFIEWEI